MLDYKVLSITYETIDLPSNNLISFFKYFEILLHFSDKVSMLRPVHTGINHNIFKP